MALSGTYTFNLNKNQIITRALQLINVLDLNATLSEEDRAYASDYLNMYIKFKEGTGMTMWKRRQAYLFPAQNTHIYSLGSTGDHATNSYVSSTVSNLSSTTLTVASATGFVDEMNIGIELDDGSRFWTTIDGTPVGNVITLASAPGSSSSSTSNTVVAYSSKINRPLRVLRGTSLDLKNNQTETTMMPLSYDEYFNQPVKNTQSRPNNFYYDRVLNSSSPYNGTIYIFPEPNDVSQIITFTYHDSLQDILDATDHADFPQEWLLPLVFQVAVILAYGYGKFAELQQLKPQADEFMAQITQGISDSDDTPLTISFDDKIGPR